MVRIALDPTPFHHTHALLEIGLTQATGHHGCVLEIFESAS